MKQKRVAVIDVGSSKLIGFLGENGVNGTFNIKGFKEIAYSGYMSGEFLDVEETVGAIKTLAENLKSSGDVSAVYVGVPGGFTKTVVRDGQISFSKKRKITQKEIDELYKKGYSAELSGYTVISRSPIFFELDDFRKTPDAIGETSVSLKGRISYVLATDYFIKTVRSALAEVGIGGVEWVSAALAEAIYLIEPATRDRVAILTDVGYISTTFTIIQGDGVLYQRTFDYGGGYLTAAIANEFDIDFALAEKVKRKATLSVNAEAGETYDISVDGVEKRFNKRKVRGILSESLDSLAEEIDRCFKFSRMNVPEYLPLLITGGGIAYLRGAKEYLTDRLNMMVDTLCPDVPLLGKPTNSSYLSVLYFALNQ